MALHIIDFMTLDVTWVGAGRDPFEIKVFTLHIGFSLFRKVRKEKIAKVWELVT